jgi:hypothetical protein
MLRPTKHSHPDRTVIAVAIVVLRALRSRRVISYDDLKSLVWKKSGSDAEVLFAPALSVLYLLGLLDYQATVDAFEYRGK